ncbi:hypothetical protein [Nocardia pseudovaccinii]|uniref:hypothetical protein n=1 Tax=Nocardia pseudovaccinii TaxID=189540 RepID=UPI0012F4E340|nr:hypothetical protein [Nocardia pseudovaccinii]
MGAVQPHYSHTICLNNDMLEWHLAQLPVGIAPAVSSLSLPVSRHLEERPPPVDPKLPLGLGFASASVVSTAFRHRFNAGPHDIRQG